MHVALIHQTDLFRPYEDPDDHWDLATVFALHLGGEIDLRGVIIDHPPERHDGVPDHPGIEMLGSIAGVHPPVAVGQPTPFAAGGSPDNQAADLIISVLETAANRAVINLAGSCRDVAVAIDRRPDLFTPDRCTLVLNAGTGYAASEIDDEVEFNVRLDVAAFRTVLSAPSQILWCPCFERLGVGLKSHEHGTWYRFRQGDILPDLLPGVQSYFAYMFARDRNPDWRRWLEPDAYRPVIEAQLDKHRPMWTTAGLLHATGRFEDRGFALEPVDVASRDNGSTTWTYADPASSRIRKFRITDHDEYDRGMKMNLRDLLLRLGRV